MTNMNNSELTYNGNDTKKSTKVVIITSADDNDDGSKILSYLNPSNIETFVVDLNNSNIMKRYQNNNTQSPSRLEQTTSIDSSKKKRKADLSCVICGGQAIGYNFSQISCESCKAFFRRNALQPAEKLKCLKYKDNIYEVRCDIRYDIKNKCQRCRLLKCFQQGMLKDHILTPEERQSKKQRLEENRQLRLSISDNKQSSTTVKPDPPSPSLGESDRLCLSHIQNAYITASQSTPSASSVVTLDLAPDTMSAFMSTLDLQNFTAIKLINFVRAIPEFEQLDEHDRLILVKYNLAFLFIIRNSLTYDPTREISYDRDTTTDVISPEEEAFAQHCKSLFILCYGYEFNRSVMLILRALCQLINKDSIICQLIMIIMIFSKGLAPDDDKQPLLNDVESVFNAQSKYIDLLFRYLIDRSSFEVASMKMVHITEQLLKIQNVSEYFQQYLKSKIDLTNVHPLIKSLFHLT